jgi:thioredoxin reductase/Pyruvate/2-oxoacid:ferredoxin oxidoreductase delta subunit
MIFSIPFTIVTGLLVIGLAYQIARRRELKRMQRDLEERQEARERGSHKAQLQYPQIDLSRCLGCGACVRACPEEGVLGLIHGQAAVLHGARCVGHGICAQECPVDAIVVTLGDLKGRKDIPALSSEFEVPDMPGLFLGGEVTGHALIRTAIGHGEAIADEVARRVHASRAKKNGLLDLCIVGAGPAGFSCSLQAKAKGLNFVTIDQESLGGTVSKYPRRKLVMTQPVRLPLYGMLRGTSFEKEELMAIWKDLAEKHSLPIRSGVEFQGLERKSDGRYVVKTNEGEIQARHVVLALGRRGTPRKLGVSGEDLPKVAYNLIDAQSYQDRDILVVGGGDSAVEAAVALAEQPENRVSLSYRQAAFSRLKAKNERRVQEAIDHGIIQAIFESQVQEIQPGFVSLKVKGEGGASEEWEIPNDDVFIMAGGIPPFALMEKVGVSFDPNKVQKPEPMGERGTNAIRGTLGALFWAAAAWAWFQAFREYYSLGDTDRVFHSLHGRLRPGGGWGLLSGIAATLSIVGNLMYLPRRSLKGSWIPGSLKAWMTSHLVTGTLALLLVAVHSGMRPQETSGGYAFYMLVILAVTGVVGRYFYALVPRAANGREAMLEELRGEVAAQSAEWDRHGRGFGEDARKEIQKLVESAAWSGGFLGPLAGLLRQKSRLRAALKRLRQKGRKEGLSEIQIRAVIALAQRTHKTALMTGHFEQLRGLLGAWRFFHRVLAVAMVALLVVHIIVALRYARMD